MAFLNEEQKSFSSYAFSLPHLLIGGAIALLGTLTIKLIGGVLTPKAR